ncbi:MAG: hypothetical protein LBE51_09275 [Acidovorax sp.]|nr:hypothetical protein [Acidovorax sp.]
MLAPEEEAPLLLTLQVSAVMLPSKEMVPVAPIVAACAPVAAKAEKIARLMNVFFMIEISVAK